MWRVVSVGVSFISLAVLGCLAWSDAPGAAPIDRAGSATTSAPATTHAAAAYPISVHHLSLEGPLQVFVARIDLNDPRVRLVTRPASDEDPDGAGPCVLSLDTVRHVAERNGLAVAINGNFFNAPAARNIMGRSVRYFVGNPAYPVGWLMVDGKLIKATSDHPRATLLIDRQGRPEIAADFAKLPAGTAFALSGSELVLKGYRAVVGANDRLRHPRSAVGLSADRKTVWLVAVDGRRDDYSRGATLAELARLMADLGAADAMNLDGGGSTTLVWRDPQTQIHGVLNRPSDGHDLSIPLSIERAVADVLGAIVEEPAPPIH